MVHSAVEIRRATIKRSVWWYLRRWPVIPLIILAILVFVGATAPWIAPNDPIKQLLPQRSALPFYQDGSPYLLGGDHVGRDVTSRVIHGARISLTVMIVAMSAGMVIGTTLGLIAGYAGGLIDEIITRIVDIWLGFPFLLLALVVAITIGASFTVVMGLMVLLAWSGFVRNVRADVLVLKENDYVSAAKVAGASNMRILVKHIFPGTIGTVTVIASLSVGGLILSEATLSFLGAGIPSPTPSWGNMIAEGRDYLQSAWWTSVFPGFALFLTVMSLNFFGDWLRDRLDPKLRQIE
jgi:peptide/nickel transport system permease protein